jgi:formate hydrogenlyase subunit 6/NADH:ubiquinone oxidoreductase subunit I
VKACPGDSLKLDENKKPAPKDSLELNCASCGACQAICPEEAVTVTRKTEFIGLFKTLRRGPLSKPRLFEDLRD